MVSSLNYINVSDSQLKNSTRIIDYHISNDHKYPEYWDIFSANSSNDYSIVDYPTFVNKNQIMIPDALFEQYDVVECKSFLGLFPEINRAWITIDHRLFLWNYEDGTNFTSYDELDQIIVSVALVKPKKNVFTSQIQYLLAIATPIEVVLLGLSLDAEKNDLTFYRTNLSVPSDNVNMLSIIGTDQGRIFLCGQDGNLYELLYQSEEGWFTRKCRKLNHSTSAISYFVPTFLKFRLDDPISSACIDTSRNILYTLSESSMCIQVFYLGSNGQEFAKIHEISNIGSIVQRVSPHSSRLDSKSFKIQAIHAIEKSECRRMHLMAITETGIRLYFSTIPSDDRSLNSTESQPPSSLELVHIRFPPDQLNNNDSNIKVYHPMLLTLNVHASFYDQGSFFCASAISDEEDSIWCATPNYTDIHNPKLNPFEKSFHLKISGKTWAISRIKKTLPFREDLLNFNSSPFNILPLQHILPPKEYLLLTNTGVQLIEQVRPIERLKNLVLFDRETDGIQQFFEHYGRDQFCAMCILLGSQEPNLSSRMMGVLLKYAGDPKMSVGSLSQSDKYDLGRPVHLPEMNFSGLHNGFAITLSRIIQHIAKKKLKMFSVFESRLENFQFLSLIQRNLLALKNFTLNNPQIVNRFMMDQSQIYSADKNLEESYKSEQQSLKGLEQLMNYYIEAISLLTILLDLKLKDFSKREVMEYDIEFITTTNKGREEIRDLISSVIQRHIQQSLSVESLSELLQEKCPAFFNADDVLLYKGSELLAKAKDARNFVEKSDLVSESYALFLKLSSTINFNRLKSICQDYQQLHYHSHAINLCLRCALKVDPNNYASSSSYVNDSMNLNISASELLLRRKQIYELIFQMLDNVQKLASLSKSVSESMTSTKEYLTDIEALKIQCFQNCIYSDDQLFHINFYDWLIKSGYSSQLLEMETPFLLPYLLENYAKADFDSDLVWKYYVRNDKFRDAALTLVDLAQNRIDFNLEKRIEYLSLAVANYKSLSSENVSNTELRKIEERLEVANIQQECLFEAKRKYAGFSSGIAEFKRLEEHLFTLEELFHKFAYDKRLYESCLRIIHSANTTNAELIRSLWIDIFNEELSSSNPNKLECLQQRIIKLGLIFYPSENTMPLSLLFELIFKTLIQNNRMDASWVYYVVQQTKIPNLVMFDLYLGFFNSKTQIWNNAQTKLFLLENICLTVELLKDTEIGNFLADVDEGINKCVLALSSMNSPALLSRFRSLQKRFSKF